MSDIIKIDGILDESAWAALPEYTGFKHLNLGGGDLVANQASFKVMQLCDRVVFGVKCMESDMERVSRVAPTLPTWNTDAVEFFLCPSGSPFDIYHFAVTFAGEVTTIFYSESGNIRPDPYAPIVNAAVHQGEDFWSIEFELPYTALYMTPADAFSSDWLLNVTRSRTTGHGFEFSTWSTLTRAYLEPEHFSKFGGFKLRKTEDAVKIAYAEPEITAQVDGGYVGNLMIRTVNPTDGEFEFTCDRTESKVVSLKSGTNEFTLPCAFGELGRTQIRLSLRRLSDGMEFTRFYPVTPTFEPVKLRLTLPEYRNNFYPGEDFSLIRGVVTASEKLPITLTLVGDGIAEVTAIANEDGSFEFATPNFAIGEATLTATCGKYSKSLRIRHLADTGRTISRISGGNLVVNGRPVLRRNMYAEYYHGGNAFKKKYDADDLHITHEIRGQAGWVEPGRLIKGIETKEANRDIVPCKELFEKLDEMLELNRERDFVYYYISDEPECRNISPIYLAHIYNYLAEKDPYHVVLSACRNSDKYIDCADWFETHPYINPIKQANGQRIYDRPMNTLGSFIDMVTKFERTDKCIGFLPTAFSYKYSSRTPYGPDYPTFREMVCHTWAAMIRGGKTLNPYAYHDLGDRASIYEGIRYIFSSFEALEKLVLLGKRTTLVRTPDVESVLYELDGEKLLVVVNMTTEEQSVTLNGIDGEFNEFRGERKFSAFDLALEPLEVIVATTGVYGAELPTYAEVDALVDRLEAERVNGGSLLFDKQYDLTFNSSYPMKNPYKLFDGVRDVYAWSEGKKDGKYVELVFDEFRPEFTQFKVYGDGLCGMKLTLDGAEVACETSVEEFCTTFTFADKVAPKSVRLDFGFDTVELYEVEAF